MEFELTIVANGLAKAYGYFNMVVSGRERKDGRVFAITTGVFDR